MTLPSREPIWTRPSAHRLISAVILCVGSFMSFSKMTRSAPVYVCVDNRGVGFSVNNLMLTTVDEDNCYCKRRPLP